MRWKLYLCLLVESPLTNLCEVEAVLVFYCRGTNLCEVEVVLGPKERQCLAETALLEVHAEDTVPEAVAGGAGLACQNVINMMQR